MAVPGAIRHHSGVGQVEGQGCPLPPYPGLGRGPKDRAESPGELRGVLELGALGCPESVERLGKKDPSLLARGLERCDPMAGPKRDPGEQCH